MDKCKVDIPVLGTHRYEGSRSILDAYGAKLMRPYRSRPLWRQAILPSGWNVIERSSSLSHIVDETGVVQLRIVYIPYQVPYIIQVQ